MLYLNTSDRKRLPRVAHHRSGMALDHRALRKVRRCRYLKMRMDRKEVIRSLNHGMKITSPAVRCYLEFRNQVLRFRYLSLLRLSVNDLGGAPIWSNRNSRGLTQASGIRRILNITWMNMAIATNLWS